MREKLLSLFLHRNFYPPPQNSPSFVTYQRYPITVFFIASTWNRRPIINHVREEIVRCAARWRVKWIESTSDQARKGSSRAGLFPARAN